MSLAGLGELARLIWQRKQLGASILLVLGVNAISTGPLCIGLPVLAASRFANHMGALGVLMAASNGGALLGAILPELLPGQGRRRPRQILPFLLPVTGLSGASLLALFRAETLATAALAALSAGMLLACGNVIGVTQVQLHTPPAFLGRVMGLLNLK